MPACIAEVLDVHYAESRAASIRAGEKDKK